MFFRQVTDNHLSQHAYLIGCPDSGKAVIIDPERDVDRYQQIAQEEGFELVAAAETHIHADFLAGTRELAEQEGLDVYLSGEGNEDEPYRWPRSGDYEVTLLQDGDTFEIGRITIEAVHTPGHTPEHLSYLVTDQDADEPMALLTGDFVFAGSAGRPDLLETAEGKEGALKPAAKQLYQSLERFMDLPEYLQVWPGHGAGTSCGANLDDVPASTVGYEKRFNGTLQTAQEGEVIFTEEILKGQPDPPRYFARMKKLNKEGPPLLTNMPEPRRLAASQLEYMAGQQNVAVVDTRSADEYMEGHLLGAVLAPLGKQFATVAGSYVTPNMPIYLIIEEDKVEQTMLDLIRIGLDNVTGYATPDVLERYGEDNGLTTTEQIDFDQLEQQRQEDGVVVLDVRSTAEFDEGHVPDAFNIPHTRLLDHRHDIAMDQTVLVHCAHGARSAVAAALLERFGYNVRYVDDDFESWAEANRRKVEQ